MDLQTRNILAEETKYLQSPVSLLPGQIIPGNDAEKLDWKFDPKTPETREVVLKLVAKETYDTFGREEIMEALQKISLFNDRIVAGEDERMPCRLQFVEVDDTDDLDDALAFTDSNESDIWEYVPITLSRMEDRAIVCQIEKNDTGAESLLVTIYFCSF